MTGSPGSREALLADVAGDLWEIEDLREFRAVLLSKLHELVQSDVASYNEIGQAPGEMLIVTDPPESFDLYNDDGRLERFAELVAQQNPLAAHYLQTGDPQTLRMSDFISARQLHALEIYDLVYRLLGTDHQLAFTVPTSGQLIGVTVSRGARDFDERELGLMDGIRKTVVAVHRNLHDRARLEIVARALDVSEAGPTTILVVEPSGLILPVHERADRLFHRIAYDPVAIDTLRRWAARERLHRTQEPLALSIQGRAGGTLQARYLHGRPGTLDAIVLRPLPPERLHTLGLLGLSLRQAEVLELIWQGASNAQIALALCVSEHTVRHHLENIYRRLGVARERAQPRSP